MTLLPIAGDSVFLQLNVLIVGSLHVYNGYTLATIVENRRFL